MSEKKSRRLFLNIGQKDRKNSSDKWVTMLSSDGQMLQVPESAIVKSAKSGETSNQEILKWIKTEG